MELVSGETLQERIRRDGPVPVEEALSIAKQIADHVSFIFNFSDEIRCKLPPGK
jgi:hypothetical protein